MCVSVCVCLTGCISSTEARGKTLALLLGPHSEDKEEDDDESALGVGVTVPSVELSKGPGAESI